MSTTVEQVMAKPKGRPKTSNRNDTVVKLDKAIALKAKHIAEHEKIEGGIAALLTEILRGPITKRYAKMLRELDELGEKG